MRFERRLILLALAATAPAVLSTITLLWLVDVATATRVAVLAIVLLASGVAIAVVHDRAAYALRSMTAIISALREGDYTLRARVRSSDDALGELAVEVNQLAQMLREDRLAAFEAVALVRAIVEQIDVAVFAFGPDHRLQLVNPAGERLLGANSPVLLGRTATELDLADCFEPQATSVERRFPGASGRWAIRRSAFREKGKLHTLLVISDVSRALREEELAAWQRIVRVLGHEINNSLAPIKALSDGLRQVVEMEPLAPDWKSDCVRGLDVISSRADALTRFTRGYARLARLPRPSFGEVEVGELIERVSRLPYPVPVLVSGGPPVIVEGDADQLEQLLINVVQNAVDAAAETSGGVEIAWRTEGKSLIVSVLDEGPGLSGSVNLFVPFFTTKPGGSGIGLVLSRQIAEAHHGELTLESRTGAQGCEARLRLPLPDAS